MAAPSRADDGDLFVEQQNGSIKISHPLADKGDYDHIVATRKMRCDVTEFDRTARASLDTLSVPVGDAGSPVTCYLVGMSEPDIPGSELLEWEETYASLPATRTEPTSITYTQQFIVRIENFDLSTTFEIGEFTDVWPAETTYEYYLLSAPLSPLQLRAPSIQILAGRFVYRGGWDPLNPFEDGDSVLAEDSKIERYMGDIFVRKSTRIIWVEPTQCTPDEGTLPEEPETL